MSIAVLSSFHKKLIHVYQVFEGILEQEEMCLGTTSKENTMVGIQGGGGGGLWGLKPPFNLMIFIILSTVVHVT